MHWKCQCVKTSFFHMIDETGCGGCRRSMLPSRVVATYTESEPCQQCIGDGKWVQYDGIWMGSRDPRIPA